MRVSTNMVMRNYNNSLSNALNSLTSARECVETERKFTKACQDPAAASKASKLTRQYLKSDDYINAVDDMQKRQDTAEDALSQIIKMTREAMNSDSMKAISDTSSTDDRRIFATALRQMQESVIQFANTSYVGNYVFSGADGDNPAFTKDNYGNIIYRGLNVSDPANDNKFVNLIDEKLYVDVGLGLETTTGLPAASSDDFSDANAFNVSIPGIEVFGYGVTDDGLNKNLFALLGQMADELEKEPFDHEKFGDMRKQLNENYQTLVNVEANMGVKTQFLTATKTRLEDNKINLYTQLHDTAQVDSAQAITDFTYAQYAYNKILQVGNSLLSNSLLDFLK